MPGPRGRAVLITDYSQLFALTRQPQHGQNKVGSLASVQPCGSDDLRPGMGFSDGVFTFQFGFAVDADWIGGLTFVNRYGGATVKDVIGADVSDENSPLVTGLGQVARRFDI